MTEHSKAPWRIVRPEDEFPQVWRAEDTALGSRNNWAVAEGIQSEADLRLIAAAPALLEFAEEMQSYLELKLCGFTQDYPAHHCIVQTCERMLAKCNAVIRKANPNRLP